MVVVVVVVVENGCHEEIRDPEGSRKQHELFLISELKFR
jgi:hypothetical protein